MPGQDPPSPAGAFGGLRSKGAGDILWRRLLAGAMRCWAAAAAPPSRALPGSGLMRAARFSPF